MKKILIIFALLVTTSKTGLSQSANPASIYEGENIEYIRFNFTNLPANPTTATNITQKIENTFKIYPQTHYNSFMIDYYLSQIGVMGFVEKVALDV
ncbi:MAG: hypothetical protein RR277_04110, partial [Rikenellaceae bacterium]